MNSYQLEMQLATEIRRYLFGGKWSYTRDFLAHLVQLMADIVGISFETLYNFFDSFVTPLSSMYMTQKKQIVVVLLFLNHVVHEL